MHMIINLSFISAFCLGALTAYLPNMAHYIWARTLTRYTAFTLINTYFVKLAVLIICFAAAHQLSISWPHYIFGMIAAYPATLYCLYQKVAL